MSKWATSLRRRESMRELLNAMPATVAETPIETHDIELPFRRSSIDGHVHADAILRGLFISTKVSPPQKWTEVTRRIVRLLALTAGWDVVIMMVDASVGLAGPGSASAADQDISAVTAFSHLQNVKLDLRRGIQLSQIPILPPLGAHELMEMLFSIYLPEIARLPPPGVSSSSKLKLLRQCTISPPMSEECALYISDIFTGLPNLASACLEYLTDLQPIPAITESSSSLLDQMQIDLPQSRQLDQLGALQSLVSPEEFRDIVDFWAQEWICS